MGDVTLTVKARAQQAIKEFKKLGDQIDEVAEGSGDIATKLGAAFAVAAGGLTLAVRESAKFNDQLASVRTLLDDDAFSDVGKNLNQGFADLRKDALQVLKTIPIESDKATKSLFDLVSAGVPASQATAALATSGKLAVAGLTDVSTATDGITSALNAYGLSAEKADTVAAKFFAAQKGGKTTIAELSAGFGKVGATAAALNVSFEEVLASVSAVTTAGVATSEAYTGLKAVFAGVAKPTADAAKEAERLGIQFNAAALQTQGLDGFLASLRENQDFTKDSALQLFGSVEAVNTIFALTGNQAAKYDDILKQVSDDTRALNVFNKAYATQSQTLSKRTALLTSKFGALVKEIGNRLEPLFSSVVDLANGILDAWDGLDESTKDLAVQFAVIGTAALGIGTAFFAAVAAAGGLVTFITATVLPGLASLATFFTATLAPAIGTALVALKGLLLFLVANPIGLAITGLVTATVALATAWETNFLGIQEISAGVFAAIGSIIRNFVDTSVALLKAQNQVFIGLFTFDLDRISAGFDAVKAAIAKSVDDTTAAFTKGRLERERQLDIEAAAANKKRDADADAEKAFLAGKLDAFKDTEEKKTTAQLREEAKRTTAQAAAGKKASEDRKKREKEAEKLRKEAEKAAQEDRKAALDLALAREQRIEEAELQRIRRTQLAQAGSLEEIDEAVEAADEVADQLFQKRIDAIETQKGKTLEAAELIKDAELELEQVRQDNAEAALKRQDELEDKEEKRLEKLGKAQERAARKAARELEETINQTINITLGGLDGIFGGGFLNQIGGFVSSVGGAPEAFLEAAQSLGDILDELPGVLIAVLEELPKIGLSLAQSITKNIPLIFKSLAKALPIIAQVLFEEIIPALIEVLPGAFEEILAVIPTILETILKALPSIITSILEVIPDIFKSIVDAIPAIIEVFAENIGPIIVALVEGIAGAAGEIIVALVDSLLLEGGLERIVVALIKAMPQIALALVEGIVRGIGKFLEAFGINFGEIFSSGFSIATPDILGSLKGIFSDIFGDLGDEFFRAVFGPLEGILAPFMDGFDGFSDVVDAFIGALQPLIDAVDALASVGDSLTGGGGGIGGAIGDAVGSVGSALGFARGTESVPAPLYAARGMFVSRGSDVVPSMLSVGERVLSQPDNAELVGILRRLESREGGAGGEAQIRLVFSDSRLGELIDDVIVERSSTGVGAISVAVGAEE